MATAPSVRRWAPEYRRQRVKAGPLRQAAFSPTALAPPENSVDSALDCPGCPRPPAVGRASVAPGTPDPGAAREFPNDPHPFVDNTRFQPAISPRHYCPQTSWMMAS